MTVTKLERQKCRKNRWSVFVDGEFVFGLDEVDLLYYKLREGGEISPERLDYLRDQVVYAQACEKAMDFLSFRPRTVKEIEKKMSEDYAADMIARVMDMLREYKYVDDAAYADEYVKERVSAGYGVKKIEWELRGRGVGQGFIGPALERAVEMQREAASAAFRAKYRNKAALDDNEKSAAYGYLVRRGFEKEIIIEILREFTDGDLDSYTD